MIYIIKDLIGSPHKSIIRGNLFDFLKNRENINVCEKFAIKTIILPWTELIFKIKM